MTDAGKGLVRLLLDDPRQFKENGLSYQLLLQVFAGHPLNDIRMLLRSEDVLVQHAGVFVASEIGEDSIELLDDLILISKSADRYVRYHALEAIAVATTSERQEEFAYVLRGLHDEDAAVRQMVMRIIMRLSQEELLVANQGLGLIDVSPDERQDHVKGMRFLIESERSQDAQACLLTTERPLLRLYAALALKRREFSPDESWTIEDEDVRYLLELN